MNVMRMLSLALAAGMCTVATAHAQDEGSVLAPIVRTERADAGVIRVVYDLRGAAGTLFTVSLEASNDGGQTFAIRPRATTGDVGPGIAVGTAKTIAWDTTKDVEDLQIDRYVFRVVVTPSVTPAVSSSAAPPTPPAGAGAAPAGANPAPAKTVPKKGGLSKGALIALAGGGAAAGVGVAATKGKTNGSGPAPSTGAPTTTPPLVLKTFNGTLSGNLVIAFGSVCSRTDALNGAVRLDLQLGANETVAGSARVTGTSVVVFTTCTGGAQPGFQNIYFGMNQSANVSGTSTALAFRHTVNGVDTTITDYTFSGSLTGDVLNGTLTFTLTNGNGAQGTVQIPITAR